MTDPEEPTPPPDRTDDAPVRRAVEIAIRIALVAGLVAWCFLLVRAFITPVVWGIVLAVMIHPTYRHLVRLFRGRDTIAATFLVGLVLLLIVVPTLLFTAGVARNARDLATHLADGTLHVPPPGPEVAAWPVVGEPIHGFWTLASENLGAALMKIEPQLEGVATQALAFAAEAGLGLVIFLAAIVIAGILLANATNGTRFAHDLARRLDAERGSAFVELSVRTVRSVAKGILGVAAIQAGLVGLGFAVVGIPLAGLWTLVALVLAVVQVGPMLVVIPAVVYVFSSASTLVAVVFLVWNVLVGALDNVLKPLLLARGVAVPMPVIFVGAIGGFLQSSVVGLFVGPVVLAVAYELFLAWLTGSPERAAEVSTAD